MGLVFVDTNILVYAHDAADPTKQSRAIAALSHLHDTGRGRLSTQVLGELYCIVTKGQKPLVKTAEAREQVERLSRSWHVLDVTPMIVLEALRGAAAHRMPYWDAQLWATARLNQIPTIFSEDFNTGASLGGVRFVDPLADGFDLAAWG